MLPTTPQPNSTRVGLSCQSARPHPQGGGVACALAVGADEGEREVVAAPPHQPLERDRRAPRCEAADNGAKSALRRRPQGSCNSRHAGPPGINRGAASVLPADPHSTMTGFWDGFRGELWGGSGAGPPGKELPSARRLVHARGLFSGLGALSRSTNAGVLRGTSGRALAFGLLTRRYRRGCAGSSCPFRVRPSARVTGGAT